MLCRHLGTRGAMRTCSRISYVMTGALVGWCGLATPDAAREQAPYSGLIDRALRLVPAPRAPVVAVDPELAPDRHALAGLDAFVVREPDGRIRQVVYINARSPLMQAAASGASEHVAVLAAVIHHEMEHLRGSNEADARRAERLLFLQLIERGVVSREAGARHLRILDAQPPPSRSAEHVPHGRPPRR